MDPQPIGMFDSGFGGLTVARALIDLLPGEDLVYVGDTGRYPYGSRPLAEVRHFADQITQHLIADHDVKLVVVACNTASAAALGDLQAQTDVPVIGVIEPGVRSLVAATRNGHVGVIGTVGTIGSGAYQATVASAHPGVKLVCAACPGFVEFVERGETDSDQVHVLAERLLAPLVDAGVDTLLLGCTHYPFLARTISDVMGREVVLVDSADETAFRVRALLGELDLARPAGHGLTGDDPAGEGPTGDHPTGHGPAGEGAKGERCGRHQFESSGDVNLFRTLGRQLLGPELDAVTGVSWT